MFYPVDSYEVKRLNKMFTSLAEMALIMLVFSLPLLSKKAVLQSKNSNAGVKIYKQMIEDAEKAEATSEKKLLMSPGKHRDDLDLLKSRSQRYSEHHQRKRTIGSDNEDYSDRG